MKSIEHKKFGCPKYKEADNLINFLKDAKAADFLDYEMDLVNDHLERLIISTKSM